MAESRPRRPRRAAQSSEEEAEKPARRERVLVAGASGALGSAVVRELMARGYRVRALVRSPQTYNQEADEVFSGNLLSPTSLEGAFRGMDAVISCAGAKVGFQGLRKRAPSYAAVDDWGNRNLLAKAKEARVKKFVYVSVFGGQSIGAAEYIRAHESFAVALKMSGLDYAVVRPTGFFSAYKRVFDMARKGRVTLLGSGAARTNPIADEDLAAICADAMAGNYTDVDAGGPDVLTRKEIAEQAFQALGKDPKYRRIPEYFLVPMARFSRLTGRHNRDAMEFLSAVSITDVVAPAVGARRLEDYFRQLAAASSPASQSLPPEGEG